MNAGMWIGIIGGAIGVIVAIVAVLATTGSAGTYITVGVLALIGGMCFLFYRLFFKGLINTSRLQKVGLPGTAKILEVRDTGVTINNNPQVKLTMEVKNNLGQKYTTTCRVLVSRINPGMFQPGMEVPVKIDPKNDQNVVIDYSGARQAVTAGGGSTGQQPDRAALQAELEQIQKDNMAIAASGHPAKAIIKKYTWLGAYVNGNNPYAELEVEVLPDNASAFSAKTRGVISEASVNKFQPGCEVYVKYDMYDNSKVVIDHS